GTFPIQSQPLFQAIKGNGGTTRLVMLPFESHGYVARESVLHTQSEMLAWFDRFVKNASQGSGSSASDPPGKPD
ncbi:MAG: alpha/beta hydrolase family protein, partial [Planctomycetota bacterium]